MVRGDLAPSTLVSIPRQIVPRFFGTLVWHEHPCSASMLQVLLELYLKFGDVWLVKLLFDDLLSWAEWCAVQRDWKSALREPVRVRMACAVARTRSEGQDLMAPFTRSMEPLHAGFGAR
eukprot:2740141-Pleurochrysis_carterae.AAC.4